jgi:methyltransferase (TIGR00027 family)
VGEPAGRDGGPDSRTAELAAALRAAEAQQPARRRVLHDPHAVHFVRHLRYRALCTVPPVSRLALAVFDHRFPGMLAEALLRCRYFDDVLERALAVPIPQLVIMGAGYDSTALRHRLAPAMTVFEVDRPATQAIKREIVARRSPGASCATVYVPCDFLTEPVGERLREHGFDPGRPCLVSWIAVSMYLDEGTVGETLREIAGFSAPGSLLVVEYVDASVIDGSTPCIGARRAAGSVAKRGEPLRFGVDPARVPEWLGPLGFEVDEHVRLRELGRRYAGPSGGPYHLDEFMGMVTARRG